VFFCKKVDVSSTQGALCAVSVFSFILHFTYLWGAYGPGRVGKVPGNPNSRQKLFKNNFPVTVKTTTSGHQTPECFIATRATHGVYGRLVHAGETFNTCGLGGGVE